jgi:hypothetical protein
LPDKPVPLFLAVEWLIDANQTERAQRLYAIARDVAVATTRDYSGFMGPIEVRLTQVVD